RLARAPRPVRPSPTEPRRLPSDGRAWVARFGKAGAVTMTQPLLLTDEQRAFRSVVRRFAEEQVAPHAAEIDREERYPAEAMAAGREIGLPSLMVPEAYGGSGADSVTKAIMMEEIARACASTALCFGITE